ncbi:MAG: hypothetical protein ABI348_09000 [Nitrososphaera sp.]|jgi:hypothetical protein
MDRKFLMGLFFGLVIATTAIYAWEAKSHIIDDPNIEGPFFLIVAVLHVPVGYWAVKNNSNMAWATMLVGTVAIIVIFGISRSDAAFLVGRDGPGGFGSLSVISKVLQAGIVAISYWVITDNRRGNPIQAQKPSPVNQKKD